VFTTEALRTRRETTSKSNPESAEEAEDAELSCRAAELRIMVGNGGFRAINSRALRRN
jgi:hypothetical protein